MNIKDILLPLAFALGLIIIHLIGEKIAKKVTKWHFKLQSFGAGIMVGIIFLELLPHIATGQEHLDKYIYLPFLFGFTVIALIEKIIYKRIQSKELKQKARSTLELNDKATNVILASSSDGNEDECLIVEEKTIFEGVALVSHGLMIGLLVTLIYETYQEITYIVLLPFFIREFTLAFSTQQIYDDLQGKKAKAIEILNAIMPLAGAALGLVLVLNKTALYTIFAFSLGLILYIVVRDMIPLGKKGKPAFFVFGVLLAVSIFLIFELLIFN
ncbi:MAG: ZIP family metal transporter [Candidatus Heimdallarchaeota archaeon]|nr:ZIP family metal transporter [Candidatus Heimdallarchaeota archaeon]